MPDLAMTPRIVQPGSLARITTRLKRLPDRDWMVHADSEEQLQIVQQVIEEQCSGEREGDLKVNVTVRNPNPYPVAWDRLAIDL